MASALVDFLKLFGEIPEEDQGLISDATELRVYKEGETLFQSGKVAREIFFICRGVLRIMVTNDEGKEVTHFFLKENQFCTILNSFKNQVVAAESIEAACDVEVLAISRQNLYDLYAKRPYLDKLIAGIMVQSLIDKTNIRNAYLGQDSAARYRTFVMRQPEIAMRVSLNNVASYLGITPQSLSRIRKNIG